MSYDDLEILRSILVKAKEFIINEAETENETALVELSLAEIKEIIEMIDYVKEE